MNLASFLALACLFSIPTAASAQSAESETWRAWLETPGGELPFGVELSRAGDGAWSAFLVNPPERIPVPVVEWDGTKLLLEMPHYDSRIRARVEAPDVLLGTWEKRRGKERVAHVPFHARRGAQRRFPLPAEDSLPGSFHGRWAVDFESDELAAVAVFDEESWPEGMTGTFLTATGDYRYLAGSADGALLRLSCFDGAHAFLFHARLQPDGTLAGDFWSGDWWHETWTARRDDEITTADAFEQTSWSERASLADLVFPDLTGRMRSLADPEFAGKAYVLQLFGSWCPNCHDETAYLVELDRRYGDRGLSILGLAFELTGEFERDAEQVRIFAERHDVPYPLFVVGTSNKELASQAFPAIDRLRSYPTTVFLTSDGRVRAVHSGFAGPATGAEHLALRAEFEALIEELLAREPPSDQETRALLLAGTWVSNVEPGGALYDFRVTDDGVLEVERETARPDEARLIEETLPVRVLGDAVWIDGRQWRLDRDAGVLVDPLRFGARLAPESGAFSPLVERAGYTTAAEALEDGDPLVRREAIFRLVEEAARHGEPQALPPELLGDPHLDIRVAATWAAGQLRDEGATELLAEQLGHANASLRRETVFAVARLAARNPELLELLRPLAGDADPLIRIEVRRALDG